MKKTFLPVLALVLTAAGCSESTLPTEATQTVGHTGLQSATASATSAAPATTISGVPNTRMGRRETFTTSTTGGVTPYTYKWYRRLGGGGTAPWSLTGCTAASCAFTFEDRLSFYIVELKVEVRDAAGALATDTHLVRVACRDGTYRINC
jgi:hypothetical protein